MRQERRIRRQKNQQEKLPAGKETDLFFTFSAAGTAVTDQPAAAILTIFPEVRPVQKGFRDGDAQRVGELPLDGFS